MPGTGGGGEARSGAGGASQDSGAVNVQGCSGSNAQAEAENLSWGEMVVLE